MIDVHVAMTVASLSGPFLPRHPFLVIIWRAHPPPACNLSSPKSFQVGHTSPINMAGLAQCESTINSCFSGAAVVLDQYPGADYLSLTMLMIYVVCAPDEGPLIAKV